MISRRSCVAVPLLGISTAACAGVGVPSGLTLARALEILPTLPTLFELVQQFGVANGIIDFNHDDPHNDFRPNRYSREMWKRGVVEIPEGLIDSLPVGTEMFLYSFASIDVLNPTTSTLYVCVDNDERIIGWMYGRSVAGAENYVSLRRRP